MLPIAKTTQDIRINNPLNKEFLKWGKSVGVDVSFCEKLTPGWEYLPSEINLLRPKKDVYDVIIFGDSSVSYGVSPSVLKQVSNKKIGFFSYPALGVSDKLIDFIRRVSKEKLSEKGVVIMMFDPDFWLKGYNQPQNSSALEKIISEHTFKTCLFCKSSFLQYEKAKQTFFNQNKVSEYFSLPKLDFYEPYIEPIVAPKTNKQKLNRRNKQKNNEKRFFIEKNHVLILKENPNKLSGPFKNISGKPVYKNHLDAFLSEIDETGLSFVMVFPLTHDKGIYKKLINLEASMQGKVPAINLNLSLPDGWVIDMQNRTHMANLGILQQSYLLGQKLKSL